MVEVGLSLLDVLDAIHAAGIVHADIKPENLFWTNAGGFKLLDFGIALAPVDGDDAGAPRREGLTMGTPGYMPPEQARGEWSRVDHSADVFAAGATLYRLLTGAHIHVADTPEALLRMTLLMPPLPVHARVSDVPQALASVLDQSLSVEPEHRFESALAMRQALELAARDIRAEPSRRPAASPHTTMRSRAISVPPSSRRPVAPSSVTTPSRRGLDRLARSGLGLGVPLLVGVALGALGSAEHQDDDAASLRMNDNMVMVSRAIYEVARPVIDRRRGLPRVEPDPGVFAAGRAAGAETRVAYGTSTSAFSTDIAGGATGDGGPVSHCRTRIDAHLVPMKK